MKKSLLFAAALTIFGAQMVDAESITLNTASNKSAFDAGTSTKECTIQRLIDRQIGPGTQYLRLRLPEYPLNVNVVMVDLNNPYNRIETTTAKENSRGTESLVAAAQRQSRAGLRPLAAANANFWVVGSQPEGQIWSGIARNVSLRNGKMVVESNQHRDQWDGGTMRTGIVSVSYDRMLNIDYCVASIRISNDKIGSAEVHQCNKGVWNDEIGMYNSFYGPSTQFMPINSNGTYFIENLNDATEVILDLAEGQEWRSGQPMTFVVKEVRQDAGRGTLGNHDLALVGRGDNRALLARLAEGDKVDLVYTWTFNPGTEQEVTPLVEQAVGGNALVMRGGEILEHNFNEAYNSQVYSRTGYGCSADGKTLYIVVIDKSTDPNYGNSAGCGTAVMCQIARYLGCSNMANFDAGGSAEMMVNYAIVNKTTEGSPRPVANGWMVYSTAPEDDTEVASLAFYEASIKMPVYTTLKPQIIAYNKYGAILDYDYQDFTIESEDNMGTCDKNEFTAGANAGTCKLTVKAGNASVTKEIEIVSGPVTLKQPALLIDNYREYPMQVIATAGGVEYACNPAHLEWTVDDPTVATIDENGVLRGLADGTTAVHGKIGDKELDGTVTVEIAKSNMIPFAAPADWTLKMAGGMSGATMADDGTLTYAYAAPRAPYIDLSRDNVAIYSLPDELWLDFNSSVAVKDISLTVLLANNAREVKATLEPADGYAANTDHHLAFDIASQLGTADMNIFPIKVRRLRFNLVASSSNRGDQSLKLGGLIGEYKHFDGIEDVAVAGGNDSNAARLRVSPNPVEAGSTLTVKALGVESVTIYSISGAAVSQTACDRGDYVTVQAPAAAGTYVVTAVTAAGPASAVLIVR